MRDILLVLTTVPDDERAEKIARALVDERLAACVNLLPPMISIYRWKGSVERDAERQMVVKTARERLPALQARIGQLHPYELPELMVLGAEDGSAEYFGWIRESVSPASR